MTPLAYQPEPSARAWHEFSQRAQSVDVAEMEAAKARHSQKGGDYLDALEEVRGERYAMEQRPCEVIRDFALRRGE